MGQRPIWCLLTSYDAHPQDAPVWELWAAEAAICGCGLSVKATRPNASQTGSALFATSPAAVAWDLCGITQYQRATYGQNVKDKQPYTTLGVQLIRVAIVKRRARQLLLRSIDVQLSVRKSEPNRREVKLLWWMKRFRGCNGYVSLPLDRNKNLTL